MPALQTAIELTTIWRSALSKLLMGPSLQVCLDALEDGHDGHGNTNGLGELHILERTSLTFLAQNCIVDQAPNLTRFKISGSLPTLQVNLSDRKYKSLMRMIDAALPKFGDQDDDKTQSRPAINPVVRHTSFARSRSRPAEDDDEEYNVEHESSDDDDAEDDGEKDKGAEGEKDVFFDTQDISTDVRRVKCRNVRGMSDSCVPEQKQNIHQKTFEFTFQVDRVQASIFRSNTNPSKPDRLLANAVLEGFRFEFGLRPFDMSVDVLLRSLYVEDKMVEDDTDFRHLITSEQLGGGHEADLVRIRYQGVQKASPEFMTVHEGIDKVSRQSYAMRGGKLI